MREPIDKLQTQLSNLHDEYQETMRQFDCTLTGTDRSNLESRLAEIDRQMSDIEREIRAMS
jgi:septal ring factor EnvC (AmiA/AmiB activator)